ncbi:hypothetical protein ACWDUI_34320, partial [Streptosporangium sandarakinum]
VGPVFQALTVTPTRQAPGSPGDAGVVLGEGVVRRGVRGHPYRPVARTRADHRPAALRRRCR